MVGEDITSFEQLEEYILRRLGYPVVEINIEQQQMKDRINDAIQYLARYSLEHMFKSYFIAQITGTSIRLNDPIVTNFDIGERVYMQTSGAFFEVDSAVDEYTLITKRVIGIPVEGETLIGEKSGATSKIVGYVPGDMENGYIETPPQITSVIDVLEYRNSGTTLNMFDINYQMMQNTVFNMFSPQLVYLEQLQQLLSLYRLVLVGKFPIRFNAIMKRVYLDTNLYDKMDIGSYVVMECYRTIDPEIFPNFYSDRLLKQLSTLYVKKQWGENLSKYDNIKLPGGLVLNGQKIKEEAQDEILRFEETIQSLYEQPPMFLVG